MQYTVQSAKVNVVKSVIDTEFPTSKTMVANVLGLLRHVVYLCPRQRLHLEFQVGNKMKRENVRENNTEK